MPPFDHLKVGDKVVRLLAGTVPMTLTVTSIRDGFIKCGAWTFDLQTGAEVDEELGWGPKYGITGSYITAGKKESAGTLPPI